MLRPGWKKSSLVSVVCIEKATTTGCFQPNAVARFDEVLAAKLPVDPRLPITGVKRADCKRDTRLASEAAYNRRAKVGHC